MSTMPLPRAKPAPHPNTRPPRFNAPNHQLQGHCKKATRPPLIPAANSAVPPPASPQASPSASEAAPHPPPALRSLGEGGSPFTLLATDTITIPHGNYPHKLGMQRFDAEASAAMANDLNSLPGRTNLKTVGLPIYVGHPDLDPTAYPDQRAYGRIRAAQATPEGLRLTVQWSNEGRALLESAAYAFYSPYWGMVRLSEFGQNKVLARPVRLYSIGLTNPPNIPLPSLVAANVSDLPGSPLDPGRHTQKGSPAMLLELLKLLGLPETATEAEILAAANALMAKSQAAVAELAAANEASAKAAADLAAANAALTETKAAADKAAADLALANTALAESKTAANEASVKAAADLAAANSAAQSHAAARASLLIDAAIVAGRVTPAEKDKWANEFVRDFAASETAMAALPQRVKVSSVTRGAGNRQPVSTAGQAFIEAVNTRMREKGETYADAWANTRRARPDLHAAMIPSPQ